MSYIDSINDDFKRFLKEFSKGIVEDNISDLDGQVVQFERVGFVRLEGKKAFFLHR